MANELKTDPEKDFSLTDLDEIELLFSNGTDLAGKDTNIFLESTEEEKFENLVADDLLEATLKSLEQMELEPQYGKQNVDNLYAESEKGESLKSEDLHFKVDTESLGTDVLVYEKPEESPLARRENDSRQQEDRKPSEESKKYIPKHSAPMNEVQSILFGDENYKRKFLGGILKKNPVLFHALGLCPLLIAAQDTRSGLTVGLFTAAVLLWMSFFSPFIHRLLPFVFRPPAYAALCIGSFFGLSGLFPSVMENALQTIGIYLPMIAVGSLMMSKATDENTTSLFPGIVGALGQSIGYAAVVLFVAELRELLAFGTLFGRKLQFSMRVESAVLPFAAFFALAFAGAFIQWILYKFSKNKREE